MIKGLYSAASAMLANLTRHGILSHNVANLDTPGFKQVLVSMDDFIETSVVHPPGPTAALTRLQYLGELGLGVDSSPEITDFSTGGMQNTGHELDFALQGNVFFRVETPDGERYTRDGRFLRDLEGNLVTVDGYFVLDDAGQRINLPEGEITVGVDGAILVDNNPVATLGQASFTDPLTELERDLPNLFAAPGGISGEEIGSVHQGFLEGSNANPAQLMSQMVAVTRAYEAAQQMVQVQDELLGKTISNLGNF